MTEKELLSLKEDIEEAKKETLQLQGQKKALMVQLKEDWECETIEEAEKKLKALDKKITNLDSAIEQGMEEFEKEYL